MKVLELPQSIETDRRPDKKFRQGLTGSADAAGGSKSKGQVSLLAPEPVSLVLKWGEGRGGPRGWAGGVAEVVCPPLCGGMCRGHMQYPDFAPDAIFCLFVCLLWLFRSGNWVFCLYLLV